MRIRIANCCGRLGGPAQVGFSQSCWLTSSHRTGFPAIVTSFHLLVVRVFRAKTVHGGAPIAVTCPKLVIEMFLTPICATAKFIHVYEVIDLHVALIQVQDCDGLGVEGTMSL